MNSSFVQKMSTGFFNFNLIFFSPLEQFDLFIILPDISVKSIFYQEGVFDIFFSIFPLLNLHCEFFILRLVIVFLRFYINFICINIKRTNFITIRLRQLYFIKGILNENLVSFKRKNIFLPIFLFLFLRIFFSNLLRIFPFHFTIRSHLSFILLFSLSLFIGFNLIGLRRYKLLFFDLFLPSGIPFIIIFFLVFIELISYRSRVISLSVRLFANLLSGHILLKILVNFVILILNSGNLSLIVISLFPIILIIRIIGLEFRIAFLQAYVFCILLAIYLKDVLYISAH